LRLRLGELMTIRGQEVLSHQRKVVEEGKNLLVLHSVGDQQIQVAVDRTRRSNLVLVLVLPHWSSALALVEVLID
jgi:hypothetical protein